MTLPFYKLVLCGSKNQGLLDYKADEISSEDNIS